MRKKPTGTAEQKTTRLYNRIRKILESARTGVARTVNTTQVIANWLIGREIVEEEQSGSKRAKYGSQLLKGISSRLRKEYGAGYSVDNLELFRRFYQEYPRLISEALSRNSESAEIPGAPVRKLTASSLQPISRPIFANLDWNFPGWL